MEGRKKFDIFVKFRDLKPLLVQSIADLTVAEQYAKRLAEGLAGECFIYSEHHARILRRYNHTGEIAPAA